MAHSNSSFSYQAMMGSSVDTKFFDNAFPKLIRMSYSGDVNTRIISQNMIDDLFYGNTWFNLRDAISVAVMSQGVPIGDVNQAKAMLNVELDRQFALLISKLAHYPKGGRFELLDSKEALEKIQKAENYPQFRATVQPMVAATRAHFELQKREIGLAWNPGFSYAPTVGQLRKSVLRLKASLLSMSEEASAEYPQPEAVRKNEKIAGAVIADSSAFQETFQPLIAGKEGDISRPGISQPGHRKTLLQVDAVVACERLKLIEELCDYIEESTSANTEYSRSPEPIGLTDLIRYLFGYLLSHVGGKQAPEAKLIGHFGLSAHSWDRVSEVDESLLALSHNGIHGTSLVALEQRLDESTTIELSEGFVQSSIKDVACDDIVRSFIYGGPDALVNVLFFEGQFGLENTLFSSFHSLLNEVMSKSAMITSDIDSEDGFMSTFAYIIAMFGGTKKKQRDLVRDDLESTVVADVTMLRKRLLTHLENPIDVDVSAIIEKIRRRSGVSHNMIVGKMSEGMRTPSFRLKSSDIVRPTSQIVESDEPWAKISSPEIYSKGFAPALIRQNSCGITQESIGYGTISTMLDRAAEDVEVKRAPLHLDLSMTRVQKEIGEVGSNAIGLPRVVPSVAGGLTWGVKDVFPNLSIPDSMTSAHTTFLHINWENVATAMEISGVSVTRDVMRMHVYTKDRNQYVSRVGYPIETKNRRQDIRSISVSVTKQLLNFAIGAGLGNMVVHPFEPVKSHIKTSDKTFMWRLAHFDQEFTKYPLPEMLDQMVRFSAYNNGIDQALIQEIHSLERDTIFISNTAIRLMDENIDVFASRITKDVPPELLARSLRVFLGRESLSELRSFDRQLISTISKSIIDFVGAGDLKDDFAFKIYFVSKIVEKLSLPLGSVEDAMEEEGN